MSCIIFLVRSGYSCRGPFVNVFVAAMPRTGSQLEQFLRIGLNEGKYPNLIWQDETRGIFQITLAKFLSRGPWERDQKILQDYESLMKRSYESYSRARGTFNSALQGSKFFRRLRKISRGSVYQFKRCADKYTNKHKDDIYTSDGETLSPFSEPASSNSLPAESSKEISPLADHSYIRNNDPLMNAIMPDVTSDSVDHMNNSSLVFDIQPLSFVPDFHDIMDMIDNDENFAGGMTESALGMRFAEDPHASPGISSDSSPGISDHW